MKFCIPGDRSRQDESCLGSGDSDISIVGVLSAMMVS